MNLRSIKAAIGACEPLENITASGKCSVPKDYPQEIRGAVSKFHLSFPSNANFLYRCFSCCFTQKEKFLDNFYLTKYAI